MCCFTPENRMKCWFALCTSWFWTCAAVCFENNRAPQGEKVTLIQNSWSSHKLVTQVARILLEDQLKYDVTVVTDAAWGTGKDLQKMKEGVIDANFEFWPKGKEQDYEQFVIKEKSVVDTGPHELTSRIGMFVPAYMKGAAQEMFAYAKLTGSNPAGFSPAEWEAAVQKGDKGADGLNLCQEWGCQDYIWSPPHCGGSLCNARLIKEDSSYDAGIMEQIISNLKMSVSVVYASNASRIVWDAIAYNRPVLFYSWIPREDFFGVSNDGLIEVALPPDSNCAGKQSLGSPNGEIDCDMGYTGLRKVISPRMNAMKDASVFASQFRVTDNDLKELQNKLLLLGGDSNSEPYYEAACMWLRSNEAYWNPWVKYAKKVPLDLDYKPECWMILSLYGGIIAFCMVALFICYRYADKGRYEFITVDPADRAAGPASVVPISPAKEEATSDGRRLTKQMAAPAGRATISDKIPLATEHKEVRTALAQQMNFCSPEARITLKEFSNPYDSASAIHCAKCGGTRHRVKEDSDTTQADKCIVCGVSPENFVWKMSAANYPGDWLKNSEEGQNLANWYKCNCAGLRCPGCNSCRPQTPRVRFRGNIDSWQDLVFYLVNSVITEVIIISALLSSVSAFWAVCLNQWRNNLQDNVHVDPEAPTAFIKMGASLLSVTNSFTFLPVFLLGMAVNRQIAVWLKHADNSYSAQAKIEDLALMVGNTILRDGKAIDDEQAKKLLDDAFSNFHKMYRYLNAIHYMAYFQIDPRVGNTADDVIQVLCDIALIDRKEEAELLHRAPLKMRQLVCTWLSQLWFDMQDAKLVSPAGTSAFMGKLTGLRGSTCLGIEDSPNVVRVLLYMVTTIALLLITTTFPFNFYQADQCRQDLAWLACFLVMFTYVGLLKIMTTLEKSPFSRAGEVLNADYILCDTQLAVWQILHGSCLAFKASVRSLKPQAPQSLFDKFDSNHDGKISREEFAQVENADLVGGFSGPSSKED